MVHSMAPPLVDLSLVALVAALLVLLVDPLREDLEDQVLVEVPQVDLEGHHPVLLEPLLEDLEEVPQEDLEEAPQEVLEEAPQEALDLHAQQ